MSNLLGVCDEKLSKNTDSKFDVNKIGGKPSWYGEFGGGPSCAICKRELCLVCQIYCPLDQSPYHRTLYIFTCSHKSCSQTSEGWKVLRCQQLDSAFNSPPDNVPMTCGSDTTVSERWGDDDDDWGDDENTVAMVTSIPPTFMTVSKSSQNDELLPSSSVDPEEPLNCLVDPDEAASQFEDMSLGEVSGAHLDTEISPEDSTLTEMKETILRSLNDKTEAPPLTSHNQDPTLFEVEARCIESYYVNVFDEPPDVEVSLHHEQQLLKDYMSREKLDLEAMASRGGKGGGEKYEKASAKHGDKMFHKFQKRIARCPQQILRYSYGGDGLSLEPTLSPPPACTHCGAARMYECQLMPALVNWLKFQGTTDTAVEFGTVLVYTCNKNCWADRKYHQEHIVLQNGPDHKLFNVS